MRQRGRDWHDINWRGISSYLLTCIVDLWQISVEGYLDTWKVLLGQQPQKAKSSRIQGRISRCPSIFVSPLQRASMPQINTDLTFSLQPLKLASPGLNQALQASNQPYRLQINSVRPPDLKPALQSSNLPKITLFALKFAFSDLNQSSEK